jgi:hypothetical protein
MQLIKLLAIILIGILVINVILLALGRINPLSFWIITIVCAIGSYKIKKSTQQ